MSYNLGKSFWIALANILRPLSPRPRIELPPQFGIERIVGQPTGLGMTELMKLLPLPGKLRVVLSAIQKIARRFLEQCELALLHLVKPHIAAAARKTLNAISPDPAPVAKIFKADQVWIAGERR